MPERILVVDDDDDWQQMFEDLFSTVAKVDSAPDIATAKALLDQNRYVALILDLVLARTSPTLIPVESQLFLDFLRRRYPGMPVVATTGKQLSPTEFFDLKERGVRRLLPKSEIRVSQAREILRQLAGIE